MRSQTIPLPGDVNTMTPTLYSALVAEFLGTALLVLLGDGVVASVVLLDKQANWVLITTGWGLAVTIAVFVSGRLSGGHLNPAVSVALAARGDFPWSRVPWYCVAQVAGGVAGAIILYVDYADAFASFELAKGIVRGQLVEGHLAGDAAGGAGVFCTFPAFGTTWRNVFSEAIGTAILVGAIRAMTDRRNAATPGWSHPLLVGVVVFSIGISLGGLTGYAINPARDLGPRLAASFLGWGFGVFQSHDWYFWVPIVGPLIGGTAGALIYDWAIARGLPDPADLDAP